MNDKEAQQIHARPDAWPAHQGRRSTGWRGSRIWVFVAGGFFAGLGDAVFAGDWWAAAVTVLVVAIFLWLAVKPANPTPPPAPEMDRAHAFAQGLASDRELLAPLDEAAKGYRAQLITDGWSLEAAEHMALAFYTTQLAMLTNTTGGADA